MPSAGTPVLDRHTFRRLAILRVTEARTLLRAGYYQGAYYLCGYAAECALKACLARATKRYTFPPDPEEVRKYYSHDLNKLLKKVGGDLARELENKSNWATVKDWQAQSRYSIETTRDLAVELYAAVAGKKDDVLKCIKKYW